MSSTTSRVEDAREAEAALTRLLARHESSFWPDEKRALEAALEVTRRYR